MRLSSCAIGILAWVWVPRSAETVSGSYSMNEGVIHIALVCLHIGLQATARPACLGGDIIAD